MQVLSPGLRDGGSAIAPDPGPPEYSGSVAGLGSSSTSLSSDPRTVDGTDLSLIHI